jgi:U3 small nucleolar RNA-associated protein 10
VRVNVPLMVRALHEAPDANVRKFAIELLTAAATVERAMEDVLSISLALTSKEAVSLDDGDGARILQEALAAIAPCWVRGHGGSGAQLLVHVVDSLPQVPEHRRLQLMSALLRTLPSPEALTVAVQLLLSATSKPEGPLQPDAARTLAAVLCSSRPALECMHAWCSLLDNHAALGATGLQVASSFVASELHVADKLAWIRARANEEDVQSSMSMLVSCVLVLMRRGDAHGASLLRDDRKGLQALLLSIEELTPAMQYLMTISRLFEHENRHVQRSALKLFAARVRKLAALASEAEAAEACCLVDSITPLLRSVETLHTASARAALEALSALAVRYGSFDAFEADLVCVLPIVLAAAQDARAPVAGASLLCIAASVSSLSTRVIPLLPRLVPIVLDVLDGSTPDLDGDVRIVAALTTLHALVDKLDGFLSPFLTRMISLLVGPHLMHEMRSPEVNAKAEAVRILIAEQTPARVLLEPLLSSWEIALPSGRSACVALLQQLETLAQRLDANDASMHSDTLFGAFVRT